MANLIKTPATGASLQRVSLGPQIVFIIQKYNNRTESWVVDVYEDDGITPIILGLTMRRDQNLTGRYVLPSLVEGDLFCLKVKSGTEKLGLDNIGRGKTFGLYWISDEEQELLGIDELITQA